MLLCDDVLFNGTLRDLPNQNGDDKGYYLILICPLFSPLKFKFLMITSHNGTDLEPTKKSILIEIGSNSAWLVRTQIVTNV